MMTDGVVDRWRIALPMIDIHTIGAGGGSIARGRRGRACCRSARRAPGAEPGPGLLRPRRHAADDDRRRPRARLPRPTAARSAAGCALDRAAARTRDRRARRRRRSALSIEEAAAGIYDIVNVTMATGVREVSVRRGLDPRDFPLVVAGGAGPRARRGDRRRARDPAAASCPRESSIFCAAGMLMSRLQARLRARLKTPLAGVEAARAARAARRDGGGGPRRCSHARGRRRRGDRAPGRARPALRRAVARAEGAAGGSRAGPRIGESRPPSSRARPDVRVPRPRRPIECLAVRLSAVGATAQVDLSELDEMAEGRVARAGAGRRGRRAAARWSTPPCTTGTAWSRASRSPARRSSSLRRPRSSCSRASTSGRPARGVPAGAGERGRALAAQLAPKPWRDRGPS